MKKTKAAKPARGEISPSRPPNAEIPAETLRFTEEISREMARLQRVEFDAISDYSWRQRAVAAVPAGSAR